MVGWSMGVERLASQASGQIGLSGVRDRWGVDRSAGEDG
jgi:hypothetical protein